MKFSLSFRSSTTLRSPSLTVHKRPIQQTTPYIPLVDWFWSTALVTKWRFIALWQRLDWCLIWNVLFPLNWDTSQTVSSHPNNLADITINCAKQKWIVMDGKSVYFTLFLVWTRQEYSDRLLNSWWKRLSPMDAFMAIVLFKKSEMMILESALQPGTHGSLRNNRKKSLARVQL